MKNHSQEHIARVLRDIQLRVPQVWRDNVVKEVKLTPTMEWIMNEALKDKAISDEKKQEIQNLIDAGYFTKTKFVENKRIVKLIDQFVSREINKEIKKGNLPKKRDVKNLQHLKEIYEKVQNPKA